MILRIWPLSLIANSSSWHRLPGFQACACAATCCLLCREEDYGSLQTHFGPLCERRRLEAKEFVSFLPLPRRSVSFCFVALEDGVDGKQARRTNSSTPLGELFDHGLDSWACIFFVATVYSIFGRGESGVSVSILYYILWVVLFSFILSHWEKYNTGILFLPWGYDVSQVVRRTTRRTELQRWLL